MTTVQELLDLLNTVQDKTVPVVITTEYGRGCEMVLTDFDLSMEYDYRLDPDSEKGTTVVMIFGDENCELSGE